MTPQEAHEQFQKNLEAAPETFKQVEYFVSREYAQALLDYQWEQTKWKPYFLAKTGDRFEYLGVTVIVL